MPDFERLHRDLAIHISKLRNPDRVPILQAEFRGEDKARKQIAFFFGYAATAAIFLSYLIGKY
jgi:hypothetical protein